MANVLRDLWTEPAPPTVPGRSRWDHVIVVGLVVTGALDGGLSADVGWPLVSIPLTTALAFTLYWRRSHTLRVAVVVFGAYAVLHGAMLAFGVSSTMLSVGVIAVAAFALARWASGREAVIGLSIGAICVAIAGSTGVIREQNGVVGLPVFLCLCILLGVATRLWSSRAADRIREVKTLERYRIARDLHDTIAHYLSVIAVQAQGGREMLADDPDAAAQAMAVIEEYASLTLAEMRLILGALRDQGPADLKPLPRIEDIAQLAECSPAGPTVEVALCGDLDQVSPSVGSGLYRLTQEAITNARRHARNATRISVHVVGSAEHVQVTVADNGQPSPQASGGYGLLGMNERATLLGGECLAGPSPEGGWTVTATIPRNGGPL